MWKGLSNYTYGETLQLRGSVKELRLTKFEHNEPCGVLVLKNLYAGTTVFSERSGLKVCNFV